jgi:hypothetical protein
MLLLTLVPFAVAGGIGAVAMFLLWEGANSAVHRTLESYDLLKNAFGWLEYFGVRNAKVFVSPLIVLAFAVPLLVLLALLTTALTAMPVALNFVASRRYTALARKGRAAFLQSASYSLGWTLLALVATLVTVPFWLIPPFFFVLPPLIWGWLTFKVMSFDALAEFATLAERQQVINNHRTPLVVMGITTGLIGAAPTLLWVAAGVAILPLLPIISLASMWLYVVGFVFTALWFAQYCLAALDDLRGQQAALDVI